MFVIEDDKKIKNQKADIRIVGVGGGGNNAIETMIKEGIKGVQFIALNTDHQALDISSADIKIQMGSKLTKGLGAGADPEIGRRAAVESYEEIVKVLKGADMVFVTAGMGGGTGTGGAPFVAQAANELGILTVGIVTKPFLFEGHKRVAQAKKGISELSHHVDTLIIIPNDKLLNFSKKETSLLETFKVTDDILLQAVKGISELVSTPGLINLDFADIRTVMKDKGMALMGRGCADGSNRAEKATQMAVSSPLLSEISIKGATGMIVNVTSDASLSLLEVQSASSLLTELADPSADIIIGAVIDENMAGKFSITVIATGFEDNQQNTTVAFQDIKEQSKDSKRAIQSNFNEPFSQGKADSLEVQNLQDENSVSNLQQEVKTEEVQNLQKKQGLSNLQADSLGIQRVQEEQVASSQDEYSLSNQFTQAKAQAIQQETQELNTQAKAQAVQQETQELNTQIEDNSSNINSQKQIQERESSVKTQTQEMNTTIEESKKSKKSTLRDILLLKSKKYKQIEENKALKLDKQISMNLPEDHEELSSPFEAGVDFSEQDIIQS